MPAIRTLAALLAGAAVAVLAACATPPVDPPPQAPAIVAAWATQTSGPLGDGTEGIERTDDDALDAIAGVRAMAQTEREDVECVWSTRTVVTLTFDDGSSEALQADSCGATGRDAALGRLVAEWVGEAG